MDRTLTIIITASVLMMTAAIVTFMVSNSATNLGQSTENIKQNTKCQYQVNTADWKQVEDKCIKEEYVPDKQTEKAIAAKFSDELTPTS